MAEASTALAASPRADSGGRVLAGLLAGCLALTALAFAPGLRGELVYDDLLLVARNPLIASLARLPELFSGAMWDFLDPQTASRIGYWRPLSGVALALGRQLGDGEPLAFHVLSLLLHLGATAAAFRLVLRLARSPAVAFFSALLFGLHPVHVEGVTWISAVNEPLFGLFALLSLDAFLAWRDAGSKGSAWKAALWLLPALLSKEMAVAVAPIALAIDLGRRRQPGEDPNPAGGVRALPRAYGPFAVALLLYWLARVAVFRDLAAGFDRTTTNFGVGAVRLLQLRTELLGGYLWLLAWPARLALFHPFVPDLPLGDPGYVRGLACILVLGIIVLWLWKVRSREPLAATLLVPAAVAPALLRIQSLGIFPLSERFLYLAVLGIALLLSLACLRCLPRGLATTILLLVAAAYGTRTWTRAGAWRSEETLFRAAVEESPRVPYARWGLSRVLLQRYRDVRDISALREAHRQAQQGLDLLEAAQKGDGSIFATGDDHVQTNLCLAWSLLYEAEIDSFHDFDTPVRVFKAVTARYPGSEHAHTGLGVALLQLERLDEAEASFRRALSLNESYAEAWHNLGILELRKGDATGAAGSFEKALDLRPDGLDDLVWLARARAQAGERDRALEIVTRAQELYPRSSGPIVMRGTLAAQKGDMNEALHWLDLALAANPDDGEALLQKSKVLLARGENTSARTALLRAVELLPESFEAHYNAAALILKVDGVPAAMLYLLRAYELRPRNGAGQALQDTLRRIPIGDADSLSRLAAIDLDRDDEDGALDWIGKALAHEPDHGPSLFLKGMLLQKRGDPAGAEAQLKRACAAMPGSFQAREELGMLLAGQKRNAEALPILRRALEIATESESGKPGAEAALRALRETIERLKSGG